MHSDDEPSSDSRSSGVRDEVPPGAWEERARAAEAELAAIRWELMISREAGHALRVRLERELARRPLRRLSRLLDLLPGRRGSAGPTGP